MAADMQADDRLLERIQIALPVEPAVLEDPDAIRKPLDVRNDVRRKDDGALPIRRDRRASCSRNCRRAMRIETGHGLIEHQQIRIVPERQQDRQLLPLAHRHALDACLRIHAPLAAQARR